MAEPITPDEILADALARILDDNGLAVHNPAATTYAEKGAVLTGVMPTTLNEFTLITPLRAAPDGRADMVYRAQLYTRRVGKLPVVRRWASDLRDVLDQHEYVPAVLGISWAWEFSSLEFEPDTQGRSAIACTYYFRGRRP